MIPNTEPTIPSTCDSQLPTRGKNLATQSEADRSVALSNDGPDGAAETTTGSALVLRTISVGTAFVSKFAVAGSAGGFMCSSLRRSAGGCDDHCSILFCTRSL